ncbi:YdcF family protein [uncultured Lactobacillus sp.]|uniref:YdcF family protein n=1 Tax=uncultured Lactobacillus sp. TaxID=153152 RepID=UPI0025FC58E6|nr:YdcF family protein [uncultured Lactobacillus sp.]
MIRFFEILNQNRSFIILSLIMLATLTVFLVSWLKEPRRLLNGILFTVFLLTFGVWLTVMILSTSLRPLILTYEILVVLFVAAITLMAAFSWLFFLWNAYIVWKRESHTLSNLLTLFIGIGIIVVWLIALIGPFKNMPSWVRILLYAPTAVFDYLLFVAYNFLVNLTFYQIVPRQYNQDYLIVLGAGLSQGETVTPLLASRINRAIEYAQKQVTKGRKKPKFIMSGGKGGDEKVAEAQAMTEYAIARGIEPSDILLEDNSKNTYQNMKFSAEVAAKDFGSKNYRAKFFSNNYHIFRASLYAKAAGLNANGVGCYTRFYFLPNAIVREFAAVLLLNKKRHIIAILLIVLFFIIYALFDLTGLIH